MVYRKGTYVPLFIHKSSRELWHVKMASFRALVNRIFTHCSTWESRKNELEWITKQAIAHGYSRRHVMRLWEETANKGKRNEGRQKDKKDDGGGIQKPFSVETGPLLGRYKKMIEEATGRKLVFSRRNTVFNITRNDKDRRNPSRLPGVYEIKIDNRDTGCSEVYIGSTARSIGRRIQEHRADREKGNANTALAQRLTAYNATPKWDEARMVRVVGDPNKLMIAEAIAIHTKKVTGEKVINYNEPFKLSMAWEYCCKMEKESNFCQGNSARF